MICNGCGGVAGRDCFNPQECEAIAQDMRQRWEMGQQEYEQEMAYAHELWQEAEFEHDRFEATAAGVA